MPIAAGLAEFVNQPIYDSEQLTEPYVMLFSRPLGNRSLSGRRKTYCDTNMLMPMALPAPMQMVITGFRCIFLDSNGDWLPLKSEIYWKASLAFFVMNKEYFRAPVGMVADPMLLYSADGWESLPEENRAMLRKKISSCLRSDGIDVEKISNQPRFPVPEIEGVFIEHQAPFNVVIETENPDSRLKILCVMDGVQVRAVL